jgi:(hydroxyamino)benzene mutase
MGPRLRRGGARGFAARGIVRKRDREESTVPQASSKERTGRRLLQLGVILFLLGLLVGFAVPALANPRMGLASHLEGVMNGMFLIALGLMWPKLDLSYGLLKATYWLALFATYANLLATFLAAGWGAGIMMPIAAEGHTGTAFQEAVIRGLLVSLSLAMVAACGLVATGLRGAGDTPSS